MIVRELLAKFGIAYDDSGAKKASAAVGGLKSSLGSLIGLVGGAALVRGFGHFILQQVELADAIGDTSDRIGVGVEALQELRFAGADVGMSLESVDGALGRFARGIAEAAKGEGEAKDVFGQLGVKLKDEQGNLIATEDVLMNVADGMSGLKTDAERLALGYKLFGREGSKFVGLMKDGAGGIEEMRQRARDLGGVLSKDQVEAADKADKAIQGFTFALGGLKHQIAAYFIPALTKGVGKMVDWVRAIREMIGSSHIVAATLITVGAALAALFGGARLLMLLKAGVAFAVIALAIDEIITYAKGGDTVIGRLISHFGGMGASVVALESWKVGFAIVVEQSKEWFKNLEAGFQIMLKSRALEKQKQYEMELKDWERRKRDEESMPLPAWVPEWLRPRAGPKPGAPTDDATAYEELRTRQVGSGQGMGLGPLALPGGAQSAEDQDREQQRRTNEAVMKSGQVATAGRPGGAKSSAVTVNQTNSLTVNAPGADAEGLKRALKEGWWDMTAEANAQTYRAVSQVPP